MIFEVNRSDFHQTQLVEKPSTVLGEGQVRLAIERFALTSNNISYALSGDMLGYWGFFPSTDPWGRVPAMGFGRVIESANSDIAVDSRYFGFFPMANEVVITASKSGIGFNDVGAHREAHAAVYTSFSNVSTTVTDDHTGNLYLLLRGLFMTSWLVDDYLGDNGFHDATSTIVTSASSKTSIALAQRLHARGHHAVGLTSAGNVSFVEALGYYDQVVTYDDIASLDSTRLSGMVDMAGNAKVLGRVHQHFGDSLRFSIQVGATHWEETGSGGELPGPTPEFFFAPSQIAKRNQDWGPAEAAARIDADLLVFFAGTSAWLTVEESSGVPATEPIYRELLEGRTDPAIGHIITAAGD
jgi:hypothetical protein